MFQVSPEGIKSIANFIEKIDMPNVFKLSHAIRYFVVGLNFEIENINEVNKVISIKCFSKNRKDSIVIIEIDDNKKNFVFKTSKAGNNDEKYRGIKIKLLTYVSLFLKHLKYKRNKLEVLK